MEHTDDIMLGAKYLRTEESIQEERVYLHYFESSPQTSS